VLSCFITCYKRGVSGDVVVGDVVHTSGPCCLPLALSLSVVSLLSSNVASTHNPPYEQRLVGMDSGVGVPFVVCHLCAWMCVDGCGLLVFMVIKITLSKRQ
jgi:hypothetical protein